MVCLSKMAIEETKRTSYKAVDEEEVTEPEADPKQGCSERC